MESLDGIDAMERLQLNGNERLYARVSHILDKYFSEVCERREERQRIQ